jgi:transposase-like protein
MDKRSRFIAELADEAKQRNLKFRAEKWRGKGGHMMVWVGNNVTTVPSRDIDPKTARKIRKALGLT